MTAFIASKKIKKMEDNKTNENSFYIAKFSDGHIDRKINLTQRDLTLAFTNGRFNGFRDGEVRIFKVDLDSVSVQEIPVSEILERIQENKIKRTERKRNKKKKEIQNEIARLQSLL